MALRAVLLNENNFDRWSAGIDALEGLIPQDFRCVPNYPVQSSAIVHQYVISRRAISPHALVIIDETNVVVACITGLVQNDATFLIHGLSATQGRFLEVIIVLARAATSVGLTAVKGPVPDGLVKIAARQHPRISIDDDGYMVLTGAQA